MKFDDIIGYVYQAATYCPDCIISQFSASDQKFAEAYSTVEDALSIMAGYTGVDRNDESSFDSDNFPKVMLRIDGTEEQCDECETELRYSA